MSSLSDFPPIWWGILLDVNPSWHCYADWTWRTNLSALLTCCPLLFRSVLKTATTVAITGSPASTAETRAIWPTSPARSVVLSGTIAKVDDSRVRLLKASRCCSRKGLKVANVKSTPLPLEGKFSLLVQSVFQSTLCWGPELMYFSTKSGLYPLLYVSLKSASSVLMKRP